MQRAVHCMPRVCTAVVETEPITITFRLALNERVKTESCRNCLCGRLSLEKSWIILSFSGSDFNCLALDNA